MWRRHGPSGPPGTAGAPGPPGPPGSGGNVTAGAGLTGGGPIPTTLAVGANADGSIVVNTGNIQLNPSLGISTSTPSQILAPSTLLGRMFRLSSYFNAGSVNLTRSEFGGVSVPALVTTDLRQSLPRSNYTSVNQSGVQVGEKVFRGPFANTGGFYLVWKIAFPTVPAAARVFVGVTGTNPASSNPSTIANTVGFAADTADANLTLLCVSNGGAITKTPIGAGFTKASLATGDPNSGSARFFEMRCWAAPNDSVINLSMYDWSNNVSVLAATPVPGTLPLNTVGLIPTSQIDGGGSSATIAFMGMWGYW